MEQDQRYAVSRPKCTQDWEDKKATIVELRRCRELDDVMRAMEEEHLFKATENQYKKQFRKWKLPPKHIKDGEYRAIISKKRERERSGKNSSAFRWRGAKVEDSNITRFQKRKKILDVDEWPEVSTPSDLSCFTPATTTRSRSHSTAVSNATCSSISSGLPSALIPAKQSPRLSQREWYPAFEDFINRSAAGTPIIHSEKSNGLSRFLDYPFDHYERLCQLRVTIMSLKRCCESSVHCHHLHCFATAEVQKAMELTRADSGQAQALHEILISTYMVVQDLIVACFSLNQKIRDTNTRIANEVHSCHTKTGRQYPSSEYPKAYDPFLTEAARWEELK